MLHTNLPEQIQDSPEVAILIMMAIAVLFCLCSEADAFVAANFPLFWPARVQDGFPCARTDA